MPTPILKPDLLAGLCPQTHWRSTVTTLFRQETSPVLAELANEHPQVHNVTLERRSPHGGRSQAKRVRCLSCSGKNSGTLRIADENFPIGKGHPPSFAFLQIDFHPRNDACRELRFPDSRRRAGKEPALEINRQTAT
jgi:hypothetical protein